MAETAPTTNHPSRRWRIRLQSFRAAYLTSVVVLLAFAAWVFFDKWFYDVVEVVLHPFNREADDLLGLDLLPTLRRSSLGPRVVLFAVLAALGIVPLLLVSYRLLRGSERERSLRNLLLGVALVAMWLALFVSQDQLAKAGFQWRVHRMVPLVKGDAEILLAKWPTKNGALPFSGNYLASPNDAWIHMCQSPEEIIQHSDEESVVGIWKAEDGGIRFDIRTVATKLEYHPDQGKPTSFKYSVRYGGKNRGLVEHIMEKYVRLEPHWFLVWYSLHDSPPE